MKYFLEGFLGALVIFGPALYIWSLQEPVACPKDRMMTSYPVAIDSKWCKK